MSIFLQFCADRRGGRPPIVRIGWVLWAISFLGSGWAPVYGQREWNIYQPFGSVLLWSVAYGAERGEFVAVGPGRQVAWDVNLSVLEDRTVESLGGAYGVALNGSQIVVGQVNEFGIGHSDNRLAWSQALAGHSFWGAAHGNGRFVVVGTGGRIATASAGLDDWSSVVVEGFSTNLYAVCYAREQFITGNEGKIWTSTDGSVWERHDGGFTGSARSIAYGRERYVMVGGGGSVRVSDDGLAWTVCDSGTTSSLRSVTFGDGIFVAVGDRGTVVYSIDRGESWVQAEVGTAQQLNSVTFGQRMFHAVSSGGQVLASRSIMTPPAIVVDPADQEVLAGSNVALEVSATGTAPLSYLWTHEGVPVEGATASRLDLADVTEANEGHYQVTVFNPAGAITGRIAFLNVLPVDQPPEILVHPVSVAGTEGGRVELTVGADGSEPLVYRWYKGTRWVSDPEGPGLILDPALTADSGYYSVVVSNAFGEVRSREVVVSIDPADRFPEILQQPVGARLVAGQNHELRVSDRSWPPPTYQWYLDEKEIPGERGASLRFSPVSLKDSGSYRVRISNRLGTIESDSADLAVVRPQSPPRIIASPMDQHGMIGDSLQLSASAEGYPEPEIQWYLDGAAVAGANGPVLSLASVTAADAGQYWIRASNSLGAAVSGHAEVVVGDGLPRLLASPASRTIELGSRLEILVSADGPGPLTWRWFRDGLELPGQDTPERRVTEAGVEDSGRYEVEVSNAHGSVRTVPFLITVVPADFAGVWMGEIVGSGPSGRFALFVRDGGSAVFLGSDGAGGAIRDHDIQVEPDGAFSIDQADRPDSSSVVGDPVGSGRLQQDSVDGSMENGGQLRGARAEAGPMASSRGFYRAGLARTVSGELLLIVDNAGRFVLTLDDGDWLGGAEGRLDSSGRAELTLGPGVLRFRVDPVSRVLSGSWAPAEGETRTFGGRRDGEGEMAFLRNTSLRGVAGRNAAVMVTGFVLEGTAPSRVLLRGIGPGLRSFGISIALASAEQVLFRGAARLAESGPWADSPSAALIESWSALAGAFALDPASSDSALALNLEAGAYTVHLTSSNGAGLGLTEIYLIPDPSSSSVGSRLVNLSTRLRIGSGDEVAIVGFVVLGEVPGRVLIRGVGPGLEPFGLDGVLADPILELFRGSVRIASNDDWDEAGNRALVENLSERVGAFALVEGSRDAALLLWLEPGVYTVKVRSAGLETGLVLAEIYALP